MDVEYVKIKSVKRLGEKANVYCLTTNNGNFVANGIVVKNCDALRYAIFSHKVTKYEPYKHSPDEYKNNRFGGFR
jgi:hypothetical protein